MPRIQLCDEETGALMRGSAGPEARRALMHRPSMAHAIGMWNEAADDSELPLRLHELVRYRIALFNNCTRCQTYRRPNGDAVGVTDDLLGAVESWRTDARYDELERSALDFTERFIYDHGSIDDELLEKLRSGLGDGGIVDLAACVAKYMAVGRLIAVLDLDQDVSSGVMIVSSSTT
ncbi:MAG: carboxymuconolactone decarboxylase family protein [Microthrixaceae bacterium]